MGFLTYSDELRDAAERWPGVPGPPDPESRKHPRGIPFYQQPLIEALFTRSHPITPLIWYAAPVTYGLYRGVAGPGVMLTLALFVAGVLAWTLTEYLLHRFVFHLPARVKKLPFFLVHGYHHEFPNDPLRLVAPFFASWIGGALFLAIYAVSVGAPLCWPLFAGTGMGYVAYDTIHYYTHHSAPTTRLGKAMKRYHLQHHYRDATSHFGISSPLWDLVFGTLKSSRGSEEQLATDLRR